MEISADREADVVSRLADRACAADNAGGTVEGGKETIACGFHFSAPEVGELRPDRVVMLREEFAPGAIA